jgi:cell division protein FtsW
MGQNFIRRYLKGDLPIWSIFLFLCLISVIEIYSAGSFFVNNKENHTSELIKHSLFLLSGGALAFAIHRMPFKWVRVLGYFFLVVSIFFLLILAVIPASYLPNITIAGIPLLGVVVENDAARWIAIFGVKFQPSEFAKLAVIIYLASLFTGEPKKSLLLTSIAKWRKKELTDAYAEKLKFFVGAGALLLVCALIFPENLSTSVLLLGVGVTLFFIAKISLKRLFIGLFSILAVGALAFLLIKSIPADSMEKVGLSRAKTWENRIESFMGEDDNSKYIYNDATSQVVHSQIAIARGGWLGVFPGNSIQRDYLPQAYADFIYAIIIEEMGLIGGVAVILLYLMFLYRAGILAKKSQYDFPALLVLGLAIMIVSQAFISMAVSVHLGPVTGQPLPLLSRGGTSIIITWIYIGIIQCVARSINEANEKKMQFNEDSIAADPEEKPMNESDIKEIINTNGYENES